MQEQHEISSVFGDFPQRCYSVGFAQAPQREVDIRPEDFGLPVPLDEPPYVPPARVGCTVVAELYVPGN